MLKFGDLDSLRKKIVVKSDQFWTVASFNGLWYEKDRNFPEYDPEKTKLCHAGYFDNKIVIVMRENGKEELVEYNGYTTNRLIENANGISEIKPGIYFYHGYHKEGIYAVEEKADLDIEKLFVEERDFPIYNVEYCTVEGINDVLEITIQVGKEDTLHAVVSLKPESMLKFYPFVYSEAQQKGISLDDRKDFLSKYEFRSNLLRQDEIKELMERCKKSLQETTDSKKRAKIFVKDSLVAYRKK